MKGHAIDLKKLSTDDVQYLVHELQVHQIELEIQNAQLRNTQSELEESRNRYSDLYDFAPIGYFTFDKKGRIIEVNLTGTNKLGIERRFLINKLFSLYIAFSSRDVFYQHLHKVFRTNTSQTCEIKLVDKNKNQFDTRLESLAVQDSKGNFNQCRTAIIDITELKKAEEKLQRAHDELEVRVEERTAELAHTNEDLRAEVAERKRAEEALRESEERYRGIIETAEEGIATHEPDGTITYVNRRMADMLGYSPEEIIGRSSLDFVDDEEKKKVIQARESLKERGNLDVERKLCRKDGSILWTISNLSPQRDVAGNLIGYLAMHTDITERKRAEEALIKSEASLVEAQRMARIGSWEWDIKTDEVRWSDEMYTIFGVDKKSFIPNITSFTGFIHADDLPSVTGVMEQLTSEGGSGSIDFRTVLSDGSIRFVHAEGEIVAFDESGKPSLMIGIDQDITERKRAEKAVEESEKKYRVLTENTPGIIQRFDRNLRILYINPQVEEATGIHPEKFIGKTNEELGMPPELCTLWKDLFHKVEASKQPQELAFDFPGLKGIKAYLLKVIPEFASDGSVESFLGISTDITERKRAEEALQKAHDELEQRIQERTAELNDANKTLLAEIEERERAEQATQEAHKYATNIVETLHESLLVLDTELRVKIANQTFYKTFKATPEETEGKLIYELGNHQWDVPKLRKLLEEIIPKDNQFHDFEIDYEFPDIGRKTMLLNSKKLYQEGNSAETILLAIEDITERKQAEEKIREQAKLLDNAQEAIEVQNLEHRLIYWNKGAERLYGWTEEEAIGKNPVVFLFKDKEEPPQLISAKRLVLEKGEWTGELQQVTKDSREVIVESHWTLIYDSEGKPKSILIINTDITEKKMLEVHLLRAQRMESIGVLAGGIAHNLNNLLTPMMMSLHTLKQKFKDEQSQKLLTILENNSQRSADLIKQVLSYSRGVEGERAPLHIANIVSEIEKIVKEIFPRNTEIRTDIPIDIWTISGDITQLHQVIMNLCVNARDAMPDGGILRISAENFVIDENYKNVHAEAKVGSYVAISVSDTGIGIPPKIVDRIFEPFFTTKEFGKGTGLGLSTVLAIVKSHGGFINVESEVGAGTTFRVYLPAIKTENEMQNVEEQQLELPSGHGELVLVAEDEDSVREVTVSILEIHGYEVLAANDGSQAVALYAQNKDKINVVLMDMMMPVMDGHASIRAIRKINPEVKIIAVSGLAEKDKLAKIESTRAQTLLPKPYTADRLLKTMHEVLSAG
ncbi:MAG: PAS domain S-box protein [Candidatus Methanoperedens sp.]|nr:PAS domain S-box protein [Candidatus Methanoperedens sp.]